MPSARRTLQTWMEGMACTRDLRFLHAIRACRRALAANACQAKRLERQAWACIEEALKRQSKHPRHGHKTCSLPMDSSARPKPYGPLKIKITLEPPAGAPYGVHPETFFVRMSSRLHEGLRLFAEAEGLGLEAAIHLAVVRGLEVVRIHSAPAIGPEAPGADCPTS